MAVTLSRMGGAGASATTEVREGIGSQQESENSAPPPPGQQDSYNNNATQTIDWNGFSLGKIPLDSESLRIELRRSYSGTDQEMMREWARREAQSKDVSKQSDDDKEKSKSDATQRRRDFSLVEPIADRSTAKGSEGTLAAKGGGKKSDPNDLFEQAMDLSRGFNDSGGRFKV